MHLLKVLHETFEKALPKIHKVRQRALMDAAQALIQGSRLSLTGLGRSLKNKYQPGNNIKRMDRLLGNKKVFKESDSYYKLMTSRLIRENTSPRIHVDWSCICAITELYLLRASLAMKGRSMVIYQACYTKKEENNHKIHKDFLDGLKKILPAGVKPVIVTDAGFKTPWFMYVSSLDWDFVGRLRNKHALLFDDETTWQLSNSLFSKATGKAKYLGRATHTKKLQMSAHVVVYRGKGKGRHRLNQDKQPSQSSKSKQYSKANKEPWILITSLSPTDASAQEVVNIYGQRMRIEEDFRDTKCPRYGFGLQLSRNRDAKRMSILLLIGAIATFACWLSAVIIRQYGRASAYQAHSSKFCGILSSVYLGREALKKGLNVAKTQFKWALCKLLEMHREVQKEVFS